MPTVLRRILSAACLVAALAGCAASVERGAGDTPLARPSADARRAVALSLTRASEEQPLDDWRALREEWQTAMTAAAAAVGATFVLLDEPPAPFPGPGVLVKARVLDFRYVSQAKRYALGVFTGNASMSVDVEFVEAPSARVLGTRHYQTSSSAAHGIFSAMTPKQVEATANEVMREVAGR